MKENLIKLHFGSMGKHRKSVKCMLTNAPRFVQTSKTHFQKLSEVLIAEANKSYSYRARAVEFVLGLNFEIETNRKRMKHEPATTFIDGVTTIANKQRI